MVVPLYVARLFYPRGIDQPEAAPANNENGQNLTEPEAPNLESLGRNNESEQVNAQTCNETESNINFQSTSVPAAGPIHTSERQNPSEPTFVIKVKVQEDSYEQTVTKDTKLLELKQ